MFFNMMMTTTADMEKFDEEGLTFCENVVQNLPTASHGHGNDSGTSGCSEGASSSGTFTSSDEDLPTVVENAIMVQLNERECYATLLHQNGETEPFRTKNSTGIYSIPFKMGIARHKVPIFGDEALSYENEKIKNPEIWRKIFFGYNLWNELLDPSEAKIFLFDNKPVYANIELMLGLFLHHLKEVLENLLDSTADLKIHFITKIVMLVPLWFKSLHRQRLKDAAKIGGFAENYIVTETSALATFHVAVKRLSPGTPSNLLILSQSSGSTDLTFYSCEADNFVEMLAVSGNLLCSSGENMNTYCAYSRNDKMINYEECRKNFDLEENRELSLQKIIFLRLLEDIEYQLSHKINPVQFTDCVILTHSDQPEWRMVVQTVLEGKVITHYQNIGAPPVGISKQHWQTPTISLEDFIGAEQGKMLDLSPFALHQAIPGSKGLKIRGEATKHLNGTLEAYPMKNSVFYQEDDLGQRWHVGTLQIKPIVYADHEYPVIETSIRQSYEGIFCLNSVIARKASGSCNKILNGETGEYSWMSSNLKASKIEECTAKLREMLECSQRYKEERSKLIQELYGICGLISERLFWENHSSRLEGDGKLKMKNGVDETLRILNEISMSYVMKLGRDYFRNELSYWRRERRMYFSKVYK